MISEKPDIFDVISAHIGLRRAGREWAGICPWHDDHNPSFFVNTDKQVFLCRACHEGGDVIDFVRKLKDLSFREALIELRMDTATQPRRRPDHHMLVEARKLARWANVMTDKANCLLRECGRRILSLTETDEAARRSEQYQTLARRWCILETLADDLQDEERVLELYRQRRIIENILNDAVEEPTTVNWPAWTAEYRAHLQNNLPTLQDRTRQAHG